MALGVIERDVIELVDEIIRIYSSIENLYSKLIDLVITNQQANEEYQKLKDYLSIALDVRDDLFRKLRLKEINYGDLEIYIIRTRLTKIVESNMEMIISGYTNNMAIRKLINDLDFMIREQPVVIPEEYFPLQNSSYIQAANDEIYTENIIYNYLDLDIVNLFLVYLQNAISHTDNVLLRERLQLAKYWTIFLNSHVEKDLVKRDFVSSDRVFMSHYMFAYVIGLSSEEYNYFLWKSLYKRSIAQVEKMLLPSKGLEKFIIRKCYLQALLPFADDNTLADINVYFNSTKTGNYETKEKMIHDCIINAFKEREKIISIKTR